MADVKDRRVEESGDAACIWHRLDVVIHSICEDRDSLENAGFEEQAEQLQAVVEVLEPVYAAAEKVVMEDIGD